MQVKSMPAKVGELFGEGVKKRQKSIPKPSQNQQKLPLGSIFRPLSSGVGEAKSLEEPVGRPVGQPVLHALPNALPKLPKLGKPLQVISVLICFHAQNCLTITRVESPGYPVSGGAFFEKRANKFTLLNRGRGHQ